MDLTLQQKHNGFVYANGTTMFVFDSSLYGIEPSRVVVTGEFRGWSQDMTDPQWHLTRSEQYPVLWTLSISNPNSRTIAPSSPFKFRIDDGRWIEPYHKAENRHAGNLIHRPGEKSVRLRAEMNRDGSIAVRFEGFESYHPIKPSELSLVDAGGARISIAELDRSSDNSIRLQAAERIDHRRVYYLDYPSKGLRSLCRRDGWFREIESQKPLGAQVANDGSQTTFGLFAPRADAVRLYLYDRVGDRLAKKTIQMNGDDDGVWEATVTGDLHGVYYDFTVHGPDDPGNHFYETHAVHVSDPYARVSVDSFGKCRVWKATKPATPLRNGRPAMEDVIAYEVHVEDFTNQLPVDENLKGTLTAMTLPGLTNLLGQSIGFDYLCELGINVVHLMPVQEYLHYPDETWKTAFAEDPYMIAAGVSESNYQWGYRTTHAFAIETRYREKGTTHGAQRDQFRDLVQAFHDRGIAVIVDLVPNHTGENMDGRHYLFNFNAIDMPYYYRTDETLSHIGPFGNEVKTEDRPMVARWLIDQCQHLINEFGIDGFRIDLAGQIDKQTLTRLRNELPDDVILYGEPWIAPSDPDVALNPEWSWYKKDAPITFFQDNARNAMKGPTADPTNKATDRGYAGGNGSERENVQLALTNGFDDEVHPNRGINYLDIHDNWALADRFALTDWDGRRGVDERRFKLAAGLLMTSLGPVVLHGGTEMMRSKGSAPPGKLLKHLPDGPLVYHGKKDTYNLRAANEFVWANVGRIERDDTVTNDFASMIEYWKGLIALRNSDAGRVLRIGHVPPLDYYRWILPQNPHQLGYVINDRIMVLMNTSDTDCIFEDVNAGSVHWRLVADQTRVDIANGIDTDDAMLKGKATHDIAVPHASMKIFLTNETNF
ncbi:alpha-amylase family glycosyl hydrolase [Novipirellula herctigrandis]